MNKTYPIWTVQYKQTTRYKQGVLSNEGFNICVQPDDTHIYSLYTTYSIYECKKVLDRLQNTYYINLIKPYIFEDKLPSMCEIHDQIYSVENLILDQSCVMLKQIDGNVCYGLYEDDLIKEDYGLEYTFFYDQDEILIHNKQVFMNGKLLYNHKQLEKLCNQLQQPLDLLAYGNKSLVDYLFNKYPNAKSYICEGDYIHNLNRKE